MRTENSRFTVRPAAIARSLALLLLAAAAAGAGWTRDFDAAASRAEAARARDDRGEAAAEIALMAVPEAGPLDARVEMLLKRAELKDSLGDYAGAEADERAALVIEPRDFGALCRLTQFLRDRGRFAESLTIAQTLVTVTDGILPVNRVEKWLQRGETFMRLGRYAEAEADIRQALSVQPGDPPSLELLVQILLWAGRTEEALVYADRMVRVSPPGKARARAYGQRADVRGRLGDSAGADADVAQALAAAPGDPLVLEAQVQRLSAAGREAEALHLLDRALEDGRAIPPARRAPLLQRRARSRRMLGDAPGAETDVRAALAIQPDALAPLRELAGFLLDLGRPAEAEDAAARFLAAAAESVPATRAEGLVLRARARSALGRFDGAGADLAAAMALEPRAPDLLAARVELDARRGRADDAAAHAEELFASSSDADASALPALLGAVAALTNVGRAEPALREARALAAGSAAAAPARRAAILAAAAAAEERLGRPADALADLDAALRLAPDSPATLGLRPRLLASLGRPRDALAAADAFVAASSSAPAAQAAQARLTRAGLRAAAGDGAGAVADHEAAENADPGIHGREPEAGVGWAAAAAQARRAAGWELLARLRAKSAPPGPAVLAAAEAEARWAGGDAPGARAAMRAALSADASAACHGPLIHDRALAAREYFDACVARRPDDAALRTDRGIALWSAGRREEAAADFRAALKTRPGFLPAAMSLASALAGSKEGPAGVAALKAALARPQRDPDLVRTAQELLSQLSAGAPARK